MFKFIADQITLDDVVARPVKLLSGDCEVFSHREDGGIYFLNAFDEFCHLVKFSGKFIVPLYLRDYKNSGIESFDDFIHRIENQFMFITDKHKGLSYKIMCCYYPYLMSGFNYAISR